MLLAASAIVTLTNPQICSCRTLILLSSWCLRVKARVPAAAAMAVNGETKVPLASARPKATDFIFSFPLHPFQFHLKLSQNFCHPRLLSLETMQLFEMFESLVSLTLSVLSCWNCPSFGHRIIRGFLMDLLISDHAHCYNKTVRISGLSVLITTPSTLTLFLALYCLLTWEQQSWL